MGLVQKALASALIALLAFCLFFEAAPALVASLAEGFQYSILIIGRYIGQHRVDGFDLTYPFDQQLYSYTRLGLNLIFTALQPFATSHPFAAARLVMLSSLVLFVIASIELVSGLFDVSRLAALGAIALAPVIFYSAYFLNDSLPSAALAVTAMALLARKVSWTRVILAGLVLGLAACLRVDALFVLPFFALRLLLNPAPLIWRAVQGGCLLIPALALPSLLDLSFGSSLLKALLYGKTAIALWGRTGVVRHGLEMGLSSFQLAGFAALLIGLFVLYARRSWLLITLVAAPVAIYIIVYMHSLYEARYFLPITPLILGPIAIGLDYVFDGLLCGRSTGLAAGLLACTLVWFAPLHAQQSEGLRPFTGQLWAADISQRWLRTLTVDSKAAFQVIADAPRASQRAVLVSDDWNADRLTHFALMKAGFRPLALTEQGKCRFAHELFARGGERVLHVRPHLPFLGGGERLSWSTVVQPCWGAWGGRPDHVLFVSADPYTADRFSRARALTPIPQTFSANFGQPLWTPFVASMATADVYTALPDRHPDAPTLAKYKAALDPARPLLAAR